MNVCNRDTWKCLDFSDWQLTPNDDVNSNFRKLRLNWKLLMRFLPRGHSHFSTWLDGLIYGWIPVLVYYANCNNTPVIDGARFSSPECTYFSLKFIKKWRGCPLTSVLVRGYGTPAETPPNFCLHVSSPCLLVWVVYVQECLTDVLCRAAICSTR